MTYLLLLEAFFFNPIGRLRLSMAKKILTEISLYCAEAHMQKVQ